MWKNRAWMQIYFCTVDPSKYPALKLCSLKHSSGISTVKMLIWILYITLFKIPGPLFFKTYSNNCHLLWFSCTFAFWGTLFRICVCVCVCAATNLPQNNLHVDFQWASPICMISTFAYYWNTFVWENWVSICSKVKLWLHKSYLN